MRLRYPTNFVGITKGYKTSVPTHKAIDLGWNKKLGYGPHQSVYAPADGVVTEVVDGKNNTMVPGKSGNYVTIRHAERYETRSCHLEKNSICVKEGDTVTQGQEIARMGNSGYCGASKGCHVHYIVWENDKRVNPVKHTYVYPDQVVAESTKKEYPNLLYYTPEPEPTPTPTPTPEPTRYVLINAQSGVWARKGIGFTFPKECAIPYGTRCPLLEKNAGKADGYKWDKILYANRVLYVPNKWNKYIDIEN